MKRFLLLISAILLSLNLMAQLEVKEGSFKEVPGFVNINTEKMYDDNDKPYAVLKIRTENISSKERHELNFGGDAQTFWEVEYRDGEVWLYISYYATFLKISHEELSSTEFHFPFDMKPKCGYELTLINKQKQSKDEIGFLTVTSIPEGANVLIDNMIVGVTPSRSEKITVGNHKIVAVLDGYDYAVKRINIESNQTAEINFVLVPSSNGLFSVGENKKVLFSKGNIQYWLPTKTWRFALNQWDYTSYNNQKDWIDMFGWGTGNNPEKTTDNNLAYNSYIDWGNNVSYGEDNSKWRTLDKEEWFYLLNSH